MAKVTITVDASHPSYLRNMTKGVAVCEGQPGQTLLDLIQGQGIAIATYCGGAMQCQACRISIDSAFSDAVSLLGQKEKSLLTSLGAGDDERFACQAKIKSDVCVFIPSPLKDDS